jgi:hypothetical protein
VDGTGEEMTNEQNEVIELMKRLGSKGHTVVRGENVRVSLPFSEDSNPNITVWPNGSWYDFSGTNTEGEWEKLGLKRHGYLSDLRNAVTNRFPKMWNELPSVSDGQLLEYAQKRNLRWKSLKSLRNSLAFPIVNESNDVIGIQTRRIDGQEPKNIMVHGSDGKNGLFISHIDGPNEPLLICEGATDTFTEVFSVNHIGAVSSSMLGGVKKFVSIGKDIFREFILAFDADDAGKNAQGEMLNYMLSIGIPRGKIFVLVHSDGCKDLNDEICSYHMFKSVPISGESSNIFVKVIDELSQDTAPGFQDALFVGFFPPDFVGFDHSTKPDGQHELYIFPESYPRYEVNRLMYNYKASAYILRGW